MEKMKSNDWLNELIKNDYEKVTTYRSYGYYFRVKELLLTSKTFICIMI